jgi:hypothetical protein
MNNRICVLSTLVNIQTLQGQCSILLITAAEQKFDEKKIVRGPGGRFGEKKDEKKEPVAPTQPQLSPEEREKQKQLNEQVEKIVNTARESAFGKNAVAKMQRMVNSLKGKFDKNQIFREAQKTSHQLQVNDSLDKIIDQAKDKIQDIKNGDNKSSSLTQWQVGGIAIGLAVVIGGILGVVQKKKALKLVEDLVDGKKIDLDIEGIAKEMQPPGGAADVEEVTQLMRDKLDEFISVNDSGTKAKKAAQKLVEEQKLAEERALQKSRPEKLVIPEFQLSANHGYPNTAAMVAHPTFKENYEKATQELFVVADNYEKKESCIAINLTTGKKSKLLQEEGSSHAVSEQTIQEAFSEAMGLTGKPSDAVLLHNHPHPSGLSAADFDSSKMFAWVHAVDTHGNVYQGKMLKGSAQDMDTILTRIVHIMSGDNKFINYAKKHNWMMEHTDEFNMLAHHAMAEYAKKKGLVQHEVQFTSGWKAFMERHDNLIQDLYSELDNLNSELDKITSIYKP